jgi:hypothetical protein
MRIYIMREPAGSLRQPYGRQAKSAGSLQTARKVILFPRVRPQVER